MDWGKKAKTGKQDRKPDPGATQKDRNKADSINDSGKLTKRIRGSR